MQESFWCSTSVQFYGNSNRIRKPSKVASGNRCVTDWLSAMKNHGVVSMKIASLPGFQERNTKELVMYQFREAVASLSLAFLHEEGTMPPAWIADIAYRITECLDNAYEYILSFDKEDVYATFSQRYSDLHSLITVSEKQQLSVSIVNTMVAEEVLKAVVIAEERGQLQQCCSLIAEAERPIIESRRALKEAVPTDYALYPHMAEQLDDLEHSRLVYLARAESTRCRHVADEMRTLLLLHSSDSKVDSELLWQCVDMYRASMIAASKQFEGVVSHECEAKAAASLGGLFDKVVIASSI